MKVIEAKTPSGATEWSKSYKCTARGNPGRGCGSTLEVTRTDLFYTQEFEREGGGQRHAGFRCPICRALTDIEVPPGIMSDLSHYNDWKKKQSETPRFVAAADLPRHFSDALTGRNYMIVGGPVVSDDADRAVRDWVVNLLNADATKKK